MIKKLLTSLVICAAVNAQAQVTLTADTVYHVGNRGPVSFKMYDTLKNAGNVDVPFNWNVNLVKSKIPGGCSVTSVCESSGQCYGFNSASHASSVPANSALYLYPEIKLGPTAPLDTSLVLVITTDLPGIPEMVFKATAVQWPTSLSTSKAITFDIYPQPATDRINIYHNDPRVTSATVYSLIGRKIQDYHTPYNTSGFSIPVADLATGMYLIALKDANGTQIGVQRFSKN